MALGALVLLGATSPSATVAPPEQRIAARLVSGVLAGETSSNVTTVDFGPDGLLYVGQQSGLIKVYDIERAGPGKYTVRRTETLAHVQALVNHDDDGEPNIEEATRLVTGLVVGGTSEEPVVYVTSSDPRIGGGPGDGPGGAANDTGLDTNSGVVSRLTRRAGGGWRRFDVVRGLPRSEENHAPNGMALSPDGRTLYVAQGGMTNLGAPSHNFAHTPEYALSAAILSVDLAAVGEATYDLPTLDDPDRPGPADAGDPFGGNDGKNQAVAVPGGPVAVYAPGFRNPYDVVRTAAGWLSTIDNGANAGWGGVPRGEGDGGECTNEVRDGGGEVLDVLHLMDGPGYYGGHPNPTREQCDHRLPTGEEALAVFPTSTNGLAEYRASALGGALAGDLLAVGFDNVLWRVDLDSGGDRVLRAAPLVADVATLPLDVTAQGDHERFPGTIWIGDFADGTITVLEPKS
ncbi:MAG: PQQ-dependent sugar dehydrogenase [Acidimicrobiia bacterium]